MTEDQWMSFELLNKFNMKINDMVLEHYKDRGNAPKYLVISGYIADTMSRLYNHVYGKNNKDTIVKFITSFGELEVIPLDVDKEIIMVG